MPPRICRRTGSSRAVFLKLDSNLAQSRASCGQIGQKRADPLFHPSIGHKIPLLPVAEQSYWTREVASVIKFARPNQIAMINCMMTIVARATLLLAWFGAIYYSRFLFVPLYPVSSLSRSLFCLAQNGTLPANENKARIKQEL